MTKSLGDPELDKVLLEETREEINVGWLEGLLCLSDWRHGVTVSRRFALRQG